LRILMSTILFLGLAAASSGQKNVRPPRGSAIDFYKENIVLTVSDSDAAVSGIYWFRNTTEMHVPYPVSFPFYIDSTSLFPNSISAYIKNDSTITQIPFMKYKIAKSIGIRVPMTAKGTTIWHLDYSQKILSPHARYILTSTAAWGRPLQEAMYKFIVPALFDSVRVWPKPDTVYNQGDQKIYLCHKSNYMPKRDMEIYWKTK
jgi:hypothetical protein